jgi:hypothetical protein
MADMLAELKDGHVNLYTGFAVSSYKKWYSDYPANFSSDLLYSERYLGNKHYSVSGLRYGKISNNIGYIYYSDFSNRFTDTNMSYIFNYFKDCKGLIIDVRNNGGGHDWFSRLLNTLYKTTAAWVI